jgi:hypothetical protein
MNSYDLIWLLFQEIIKLKEQEANENTEEKK